MEVRFRTSARKGRGLFRRDDGIGRSFIRWHPRRSAARSAARRIRSRRSTSASTASGRSRSPTTTRGLDATEAKRKIQAGPAGIWRYADFLPFAERPRDPLQPGLTPLVRADRLAERLGLGELWIKNDAANPTHSFKDRVVAVALAKARELGFDDGRLRVDRQPGERGRRPRGRRGARVVRVRPVRPRGAEAARHRRLRHPPGRRAGQLRRRQPALHRAGRDAALGVRERQPAPVLRGGLEDDRLRARRAARLVAARPDRLPDRLRLAVHEDRQGPRGVARARPGRGRAAGLQRRPGRRAAARSPRRTPRARTSAARSARARSPRASRSAIRPTAPTRSSSRGGPAGRSSRSPTTRSAPASACSPRRPGSSPRPPAA